MSKDLTNSPTERQNILNNDFALVEVEKAVGIWGIPFEGGTVVLKEHVAAFFEVTPRTIGSYLERFATELGRNGYEVIRDKRLQDLKLRISQSDVHETDFVNIRKSPQLGMFPFRAFLNLSMLVAESERARMLRSLVLDIRPFMAVDLSGGRKNAGVLRYAPKVKWKKDRGKEPKRPIEEYRWFWSWDEKTQDFQGGDKFTGERWKDLHYTVKAKQLARESKTQPTALAAGQDDEGKAIGPRASDYGSGEDVS